MKNHPTNPEGPLPYSGQELDRRANLGTSFGKLGHGSDQENGRTYRFNRLGYRGPEFDPAAAYRIYAFGESHAFGYCVDDDVCWPARFAAHWVRARGLDPSQVCFQNFADVGSSNAGIARAVVTQCSAAPPDLVLVHFAEHRRGEVYIEGRPHRIGPWLLDEATARAAPPDGPLRAGYLHQIERARAFYGWTLGDERVDETIFDLERDATSLEDTLRNLLLVQYFCRARGIPALATCDLVDSLFDASVRRHESLGPLLAEVDPDFLTPLRIWSVEGDLADDGHHAGPERHDRFARAMLRRYLESPPMPAASAQTLERNRDRVNIGGEVRRFYDEQPFNHWTNVRAAAASVRDPEILSAYPDLHRQLDGGGILRALDAGCGGGWLSAALAFHHGLEVVGVDFSQCSLDRAQELANALGVGPRVQFVEADLLALDLGESFDLVVSLGVLHHTADPRGACQRIARHARPGGALYLGLYHRPGRRPFLDHFRQLIERDGPERAFEAFRRLSDDRRSDEEHLRSWFRDQVLHPRESQHTLREVNGWLTDLGWRIVSTSINRFERFERVEDLFPLEAGYAHRSERALAEDRFFPGFFTVLARRVEGGESER